MVTQSRASENRMLNESEIQQKKTLLDSKFQGLGVALTSRCNLRCIMCKAWEAPWDIPAKVVEEIASVLPFLSRVYWQGGEVFYSRYFADLFNECIRYPEIEQEIVTSGLPIDRSWAEKLVRANIRTTFSIDGITRKVYEHIRQGAKYSDMLASLRLVREERSRYRKESLDMPAIRTAMNFVVMKSNYHEICETVEFAHDNDIDDLTLTPIYHILTDENIFLHHDLEAFSSIQKDIEISRKKAEKYGIRFFSWVPEFKTNSRDLCASPYDKNNNANGVLSCLWPWQNLFVDIGGGVKPNCVCVAEVGSIHLNTLSEIWNNEKMQLYRKKIASDAMEAVCNKNCIANLSQNNFFSMR